MKEIKKKDKKTKKEIIEEKDDGWIKYIILGVIIMVILSGLIFGSIVAYQALNKAYSLDQSNQTTDDIPNQTAVEVEEPANIDFEKVFVKKTSETLIPLKISNVNETATFKIKINEDIDWLTVDVDDVEIKPNESYIVNLIASPNQSVDDGNYKVTVNVDIEGEDTQFTQGFVLQVREGAFSAVWSYALYALVGLIILIIILIVLRKKESRNVDENEKTEKESKKKTSIKIK